MIVSFNVNFYNNVGYSEESVQVPSKTLIQQGKSALGDPYLSVDGVVFRRNGFFSEMVVPADSAALMRCKYLAFTLAMKGYSLMMYGWIDSVEINSEQTKSSCIVHWHIDNWRTYFSFCSGKYGIVTRKPKPSEGHDYPIQKCNSLFYKNKENIPIVNSWDLTTGTAPSVLAGDQLVWIIVSRTVETSSSQIVGIEYDVFPCLKQDAFSGSNVKLRIPASYGSSTGFDLPTVSDFLTGKVYANAGIAEASVNGIWITSISPVGFFNVYFYTEGTANYLYINPLEVPTASAIGAYGCYKFSGDMYFNEVALKKQQQFSGWTVDSDETQRVTLCNVDGSVVGSVPNLYHPIYSEAVLKTVISPLEAHFTLYCNARIDGRPNRQTMTYDIPMISIPLNSNSWSEYVYSGQRDYDQRNREISRDSQFWNSLLNSMASGLIGTLTAVPSALTGNVGAATSAAGAGLKGEASAGINWAVSKAYDSSIQEMIDTGKASAIDSINRGGESINAWFNRIHNSIPYFQIDEIDDYSKQLFYSQLELNGVSVCEPTADCSEILNGNGPVAIDRLQLTSYIATPEALKYIKGRLSQGVILTDEF